MNRDEIRIYLQGALEEITDCDSLVLDDPVAPHDVPGWDSVNHIKLVFAVESELTITFEMSELVLPDTVGAFLDLIQSKL
jgi:acyl carrier protein